jgi:hypothetical protein
MVKTIFSKLLFSIFLISMVFGQEGASAGQDMQSCGDPTARFDVKTEKGQGLAQPEAGKSLLHFIEDDTEWQVSAKPVTRFGLDGTWVGATYGNSYFYVSVTPGVHHLCASWQPASLIPNDKRKPYTAAHFTAEAGGVYYFMAENTFLKGGGARLNLKPLDSDEGQLLIKTLKFSTSLKRK